MALSSGEYGYSGEKVILDEKGDTKSKMIAGKTTKEFEHFSRGFRQNLMLAMNLVATATSRLSCWSSKVSYVYITRLTFML